MASLLALLILLRSVHCEWDEIPELLPNEEGSLVSVPLGLPEAGHVLAFGHFTADRRLDCLVLGQMGNQLSVYIMKPSDGLYYKSLATAVVPQDEVIIGAIMSDFDHDGWADVLVMHRPRSRTSKNTKLTLFLGDGESLRQANWDIAPARDEVFPVDFMGNLQLSLFGVTQNSKDATPSLWQNSALRRDEVSKGFMEPFPLATIDKLAIPGWHAQTDFNGDGRADLLLMMSEEKTTLPIAFEIWQRETYKDEKVAPYTMAGRYVLPRGTGPLTVTDVDGDGHADVVFVVCDPPTTCADENSLHIMFNIQRRFCSRHHAEEGCKTPDEHLFNPNGESFKFDSAAGTADHIVLTAKTLFPGEDVRFSFEDPSNNLPVSLSVGDFDLDSYPDLAVVLADRSNPTQKDKHRAAILHNMPCVEGMCTAAQITARRRTFVEALKGMEAVRTLRGVSSIAFADWYSMGAPGFLVNLYDSAGKTTHRSIKNAISRDAFSLRTETLNGVCPAPCKAIKTGSASERPVGVNYVGASCRFSFVDPDGATQIRSGTQLSQTAHRALQSSTLLFGLGRTSNFVQTLEVATPGLDSYAKNNIFPNSEIMFVPPHADAGWRAELQINPGEYLIFVGISVAVALVVLAIITAIFKWQERREDEIERRKATHLINFDAL
ncbi:hypothetical protein PSACC_02914 [Paramicrosporidium saccamoebae]|uniref:T-cell immunomodulatory protein TIP C2 domain-containing protein n=1 Tax=Paramicrosporidium saccamoebae TaxID=1246581 RepID=A0A2H9THT7_9FUNG|nr:hypothetical protein PSACC_02914 [Paramicrosporidium saccamoebae]